MKKVIGLILWLVLISPGLCLGQGNSFILLASTIGPIDSGIVDLLENEFEKESGIRVRHVGAGTGAALEIAKKGNVDLAMVHAKSLEEKFVQEGFGTERISLMYNDFVIVGPANDPAGIRGMKSATEALKRISEKGIVFVTRGDKSGTHVAEMELWQKAGIKPQGSWYYTCERGAEGNVPTLRHTDKMQAYTFIDRATVLSLGNQIKLVALVEKDEVLLNFISLIPINPQKFPRVNHGDTLKFVKWLTSPEKGQKIIEDFGRDKYGSPLFFPNSKEWREAKGIKK
jgi:tungstate transport system substrate-binding protein